MQVTGVLDLPSTSPRDAGPYKFLDYYAEDDRTKFAGRERDIREVVARICTNRTFVLYAQSGLGKTSLLLAGIFPALRLRGFFPIYVRTLQDPLTDLFAAVAYDFKTAPFASMEALTAALEERSLNTTTVLVFDQFEEFFIHFRHEPQRRAAFVESVAALEANPKLKVRLVFSLREDYLAELDDIRDLVPDLFANDYRLRPLSAFGARQAIAQPLIEARVQYERRLLVKLVDLLAEVGFDPLMLQILCTEVYGIAAGRTGVDRRLTEADLEQAGGLDGVVRRYLDRVIAAIPKGTVLLSRTVLDTLITQEKTKRAVTFDAFVNADFSASPEELRRVLDVFKKHRLIREERRCSQLWYELGHERLVGPVLDWLKLDENFFNFRVARDLIANSCSGEVWRSNLETLLAEGALKHVIGRYENRLRVTPVEAEFVYRSGVYRGTDTSYWATVVGRERCEDILLEFFASPSEQARIAAARAAATLPNVSPALADSCLTMALSDASAAARRAAGRTLATLGTEVHLRALRSKLGSRATRRDAIEVIADLCQAGRPLTEFGRRWRLRAKWIANRRLRRQHEATIREQGRRGAVTGVAIAAAWSLTVALIGLTLGIWATGYPASTVVEYLYLISIAAIAGGGLVGWRLGRVAALDVADHGSGRWFRVVMRVKFVYITLLVWCAALSAAATYSGGNSETLALAGVMTSFVVMQLAVAGMTKLAKRAVWGVARTSEVLLWSLIASAGAPPLAMAVTIWLVNIFAGTTREEEPLIAAAAGLVSAATAVATATLARTQPPTAAPPTVDERFVARTRLAVLAAAIPVWFVAVYGVDSIPIRTGSGRTIVAESGRALEFATHLRPGLSDSAYFWITMPPAGGGWVRVVDLPSRSEAVFRGQKLNPSQLLYLSGGRHRLAVRGQVHGDDIQAVRLERLRVDPRMDQPALDEAKPVVVTFRRRPNASEWLGSIRFGALRAEDREVQLRLALADYSKPAAGSVALSAGGEPGVVRLYVDNEQVGRSNSSESGSLGKLATPALMNREWALGLKLTLDPPADDQPPRQDTYLVPFIIVTAAVP